MTLQTTAKLKADATEFLVDTRKLPPKMQGVICGMAIAWYLFDLCDSEISTTNEIHNPE